MTSREHAARLVKIQSEMVNLTAESGVDLSVQYQAIEDVLTLSDRMEPVDMMALLAEEVEPVIPDIGHIVGRETGLFYRGAVNMLYGTDNCGKTMLMQAIVLQELEAGNEVLYIDGEEGSPRNMVLRLQAMGIDPALGARLHYFNIVKAPSIENRMMFADYAARCSLVVIDSAGELMGMYGKDAVKDLETRGILFEMYGRPLAKMGPAVVILDHIAKSSDGGQPIGTIRKRAGIDGAAYFMHIEEGDEWSKSRSGEAQLVCQKDRNGTYYRTQLVARMQVFPLGGKIDIDLMYSELDDLIDEEPAAPASQPLDMDVMQAIEEADAPATAKFIQAVLVRTQPGVLKKDVQASIDRLASDGFVMYDRSASGYISLRSVSQNERN